MVQCFAIGQGRIISAGFTSIESLCFHETCGRYGAAVVCYRRSDDWALVDSPPPKSAKACDGGFHILELSPNALSSPSLADDACARLGCNR